MKRMLNSNVKVRPSHLIIMKHFPSIIFDVNHSDLQNERFKISSQLLFIFSNEPKKKILRFLLIVFWMNISFDSILIAQETFDYERDYPKILAASKTNESPLNYSSLIERYQSLDTSLSRNELLALMIGFTAREEYAPYALIQDEVDLIALINKGKYKQAYSRATDLLKTQPFNFVALMERFISSTEIDHPKSQHYKAQFFSILETILATGDGSNLYPFFVIGPADGQIIIRYIWGLEIEVMGSGSDMKGNFCDMLEMVDEDQNKTWMYFVLEHAIHLALKK